MTKEAIIKELANDSFYRKTAHQITGGHDLTPDLLQYTLIFFFEMDDARLQHLHTNNQLRAFATIIMRRQWFVPEQPFNRLYNHLDKSIVHFDEVSAFLSQDIGNTRLDDIYNEMDKLFDKEIEQKHSEGKYPYEIMLFKLYLEHGSTRKVQAVTGIPYRSIARTIAGLRERLKEKIGKEV